jgi:hypothetical protein
MKVSELRGIVLSDKAARRRYLVTAAIPEKLRILEEMRDLTLATRAIREANKVRTKAIWDRSERA